MGYERRKNCYTCTSRPRGEKTPEGFYFCSQGKIFKNRREMVNSVCPEWRCFESPTESSTPAPFSHDHDYSKWIPQINEAYFVRENLWETIQYAYEHDLPLALEGDAGSGKTEAIRQFAAAKKIPVYRANLDGQVGTDSLIGKWILRGGEMVWVDGIITVAVRDGGILILDELNAAEPEVLFCLVPLLDNGRLVLLDREGEILEKNEKTRIFATLNPLGALYSGTRPLNYALRDRFPLWVKVDYPTPEEERQILIQYGCEGKLARRLVEISKIWRDGYKMQEISTPLTTRRLIHWAKIAQDYGVKAAAQIAVFGHLSEDERVAVEAMLEGKLENE